MEVWLIELDQAAALLLADDWPEASPVGRITAALPALQAVSDSWVRHRRAAHVALRLILARQAGINVAAAPFTTGPLGKPELAMPNPGSSASPSVYFNLSHSAGRAVVAVSPEAEIGVDIEGPREPKLSPSRRAAIMAAGIALADGAPLSAVTDGQRFLQAWVRLEAIAKCSGRGMGRLLGDLGIIGGGDGISGPGGAMTWCATSGWQGAVRDIALDRGFHGAVAGPVSGWTGCVDNFPDARSAIERFLRYPR